MAAIEARSGGVTRSEAAPPAVRACTSPDEFRQCVELQKTIWGFDPVDVLPVRLFVVGSKIGGQVFGAFDVSGRMVGFCLAIPGLRNGRPYLHSHMLGVLPEYQNRHVGRALKLKQREDALARGLSLVEWTFDPLEVKNAFFNIERLGVIVRRYVPNQYGHTTSALHGGLPTDRLVAEWWVASERVRTRLDSTATPRRGPGERKRILVPASIGEIKGRDREAALEIQSRLREEFLEAFKDHLVVTGFERGEPDCAYLLEKTEGPEL